MGRSSGPAPASSTSPSSAKAANSCVSRGRGKVGPQTTREILMDRRDFLTRLSATGAAATLSDALAQAPSTGAAPSATPVAPPGTIENDFIKKDKAPALQWHSERPLTGSVPAHEHDFEVTPTDRMFVRNNLLVPQIDLRDHRLKITGLVDKDLE